jgi:hypothetical protein
MAIWFIFQENWKCILSLCHLICQHKDFEISKIQQLSSWIVPAHIFSLR